MAVIHRAQISPSKPELLARWVPTQPWGDVGYEPIGAYRFDDPADQVGIESHILADGDGRFLHVPLTYRGAPLDGADDYLVTTMTHSVLGQRWIYDAVGDPVYAQVLASVLLDGVPQAISQVEVDGVVKVLPATVQVSVQLRSGTSVHPIRLDPAQLSTTSDDTATVIHVGEHELVIQRRLGDSPSDDAVTLVGTWADHESPTVLAHLS